jgi:hypothetical protein
VTTVAAFLGLTEAESVIELRLLRASTVLGRKGAAAQERHPTVTVTKTRALNGFALVLVALGIGAVVARNI